jgi:hypothetical protein
MGEIDNILIEKYLDKSLTAAEQQTFEGRLTDPAFAHEVKRYKEALMSIYTLGDDRIKSILQEEEAKMAPPQYSSTFIPKISPRLTAYLWWSLAAGLLVVISVGYWIFTNTKTATPDALFASKFEAYPSYSYDGNPRGKSEETALKQVYTDYNNGKFSNFIAYFEKIDNPTNDELFLMANAYLGIGESGKSIPILLKIAENSTNTHKEAAEWYLALAYLKQGNVSECSNWLAKIKAHTKETYKDRANKLIDKLQ